MEHDSASVLMCGRLPTTESCAMLVLCHLLKCSRPQCMLVHILPHCYGGIVSLGPCRVYSSVRTILVQESQIPTGKAPASAAAVEQAQEQAAITSAVWLEAGMAAAETPAAAGEEAASDITAPRSSKSGTKKKKSKIDLQAGPSDATAAAADSEAAPVGATAGKDGKKKSRKSKADQVTVSQPCRHLVPCKWASSYMQISHSWR